MDGSHQGSTPQFTKWTDPTRVKFINPQSGRIPPKVNTIIHKVDGPNQGQTYTSPKSGRTQQGSNLCNSKKGRTLPLVNTSPRSGRTQPLLNLRQSTKWTDPTNVQDPNPHNGRTQPVHKIIQVHKVDSHQGSRPHSTEWTDPTRVANFIKVHNVDGSN